MGIDGSRLLCKDTCQMDHTDLEFLKPKIEVKHAALPQGSVKLISGIAGNVNACNVHIVYVYISRPKYIVVIGLNSRLWSHTPTNQPPHV